MAQNLSVSPWPRILYLPELLTLRIDIAAFATLLACAEFINQVDMVPRFLEHRSHAFALGGLVVPMDGLLPISDCHDYLRWVSLLMKFMLKLF